MRAVLSLFVCLVFVFLAFPAQSAQYRVVDVTSGDTITLEPSHGGDRTTVKLYGIDCPEMDQPFGQPARLFVINAARFKRVYILPAPQDKDSDGRRMVMVEIPGRGILQELLLTAGLAWVSPQYCQDCDEWKQLETAARDRGRGLWARGEEAVPPWEWREGKRPAR